MNEIIEKAFQYMIMLEATNIVESKALYGTKINNRAAVKKGVDIIADHTNQLFKYNDFNPDELQEFRRCVPCRVFSKHIK